MAEEYLDSVLVNLNENKPANSDSIGTAAAAIRQIKRCLVSKEAGGLIELIKDTVYHSWYDVGDIYITQKDDNPAVKFGGTWEKIDGKILLSSGNVPSNLPIPSDFASGWFGKYKMGDSYGTSDDAVRSMTFSDSGKNTILNLFNDIIIVPATYNYSELHFFGRCFKRGGLKTKVEGYLDLLHAYVNKPYTIDLSVVDGKDLESNTIKYITRLTLNQGVKTYFNFEIDTSTLPDIYYIRFSVNLNLNINLSSYVERLNVFRLEASTNITYDSTTYVRNGDVGSLFLPYLGCNMWRKIAN